MWHPKKNLDPFLPVFSHFFMSYFDVFGSIFEKSAMTDLPKVIVSICLVSYNICMIPHVWRLTFGLNLSGAWGALYNTDYSLMQMSVLVPSLESRLGEDLLPSREVPGAGNRRKDPYRASTHPNLAPGTRMGRARGLLRGEVTTATTHLIKITPPIR